MPCFNKSIHSGGGNKESNSSEDRGTKSSFNTNFNLI